MSHGTPWGAAGQSSPLRHTLKEVRELRGARSGAAAQMEKMPRLRIMDRYGIPEHDCTDHFEVTFEVDGCRDHVEGHHIAICKVCGEDITEQLEEMDDREPDHDDYEEGA